MFKFFFFSGVDAFFRSEANLSFINLHFSTLAKLNDDPVFADYIYREVPVYL